MPLTIIFGARVHAGMAAAWVRPKRLPGLVLLARSVAVIARARRPVDIRPRPAPPRLAATELEQVTCGQLEYLLAITQPPPSMHQASHSRHQVATL